MPALYEIRVRYFKGSDPLKSFLATAMKPVWRNVPAVKSP